MVFTPINKLLKHQKNPQNEAAFDLFLDISEIGGKLSKMDVSENVYNEDIYIPTNDNKESLTDGYYEMQPVLIQANVPTENAANLQNGNYHIDHVDHGNVEYHIQNESRSSSPHIADTVDHDNIELDSQNEPKPSSAHLEVLNMPASPEMEVPNMPASPEMEVPNMDSSSDNDDNDGFGDDEEDNPILSQIRIFNCLCQLRITLEILIILMTLPITGYGKFEIQEHLLHHLLEPQDSYWIPQTLNQLTSSIYCLKTGCTN